MGTTPIATGRPMFATPPLTPPKDANMPTTITEEQKELLFEYLLDARSDREAGANNRVLSEKMDKVMEAVRTVATDQAELRGDVRADIVAVRGEAATQAALTKGAIDGLSLRVTEVEKKVDALKQDGEVTGRHNLAKIEAHVVALEADLTKAREAKANALVKRDEKRVDAAVWWKRNWIKIAFAAAAALATGLVALFVEHVIAPLFGPHK